MGLAFLVGVVAGVGAVCRYVIDRSVTHHHSGTFPWGTFVINVAGSFLLGCTTGLATHHGLSATVATVIASGFCGGFSTFSTWMWETLALGETGALRQAGLNLMGSLGLGMAAAGVGLWLTL